MSHVDEGRLEAWIDRDRSGMSVAEAEAIARHIESCASCSSLLAEVTRLRERAASILGGARLDDRRTPDFERVRARAGAVAGEAKARPRPIRPPLVAYAWAASLVAAIGLGWLTRDLLGPRPVANQADSGLTREVAVQPVEVDGAESPSGASAENERVALAPSAPSPLPSAPTPPAARVGAVADSRDVTLPLVLYEDLAIPESGGTPDAVAAAPESGGNAHAAGASGEGRTGVVAQGRVVTPSGEPLPGASVLVGPARGTLTDSDGRFAVLIPEEQLVAGAGVPLTVTRLGYAGRTLALADTGSDTITAQIELAPAMLALSEIVVAGYGESRDLVSAAAAEQPNTPVSASVARASEEGSAPRAPTPPVLLQSVSGATATMSEANRRLGSPVVSIPGLEVLSVELAGNADAPIVRLRQRLPEGGILLLIESIEPLVATDLEDDPGVSSAQVRRGSLYVTGVAPIPVEALERLLDTAR